MINSTQNNSKAIGLGSLIPTAGILLVIFGGIVASQLGKTEFLHSYFFGWLFFTCLTFGCLGATLLHHTVRGAWGLSILRLIEAGGSPAALVAMLVGWVPILLNAKAFYSWADPAKVAEDHVLSYRAHDLWGFLQYQQSPWMWRTIVCFAILIFISHVLRKSSQGQDKEADPVAAQKMVQFRSNFAPPCIVVYFFVCTVLYTDWVMSIDAHWYSTMMPAWFIVGSVLTALALCNVIVLSNASKEPYNEVMNKGLSKDLGNMMFVFSLLWAYTSFSQFIIIWAGNLPELTTFYYARVQPIWEGIGVFVIFGQFLFPFVSLMAPRAKSNVRILRNIAIWVLLMRFVDVFWITIPFFRTGGFSVTAGDALAVVAFGSLWALVFGASLAQGNLLPTHDPRLKEAYAHA